MSAWNISVFSNDDAADFSSEFDDANTIGTIAPIIENALDNVLDATDYLDKQDGAPALAAAALVVAWKAPEMLGNDAVYAPEPWPRTSEPMPGLLMAKAAAVLDRMVQTEENEVAELWADEGQTPDYTAEIARWRAHLP